MPPKKRTKLRGPRNGPISKKISKDSREAQLWERNAQTSRLLCLPAEIRLMIYELVLGGNTIKIHSEVENPGPRCTEWKHIHKGEFSCTVGPGLVYPHYWRVNEFREHTQAGFTLLNSVCRQLYKETAELPYRLNTFAFDDDYLLKRYTMVEKRLPLPQRRALQSVHLDRLPDKPLQKYLGGLECVLVRVYSEIVCYSPSKDQQDLWEQVKVLRQGVKRMLIERET